MTFKVTLMSLNFERYNSLSRMTKFSSLQENSITNILVLKSIRASLIMCFDTNCIGSNLGLKFGREGGL